MSTNQDYTSVQEYISSFTRSEFFEKYRGITKTDEFSGLASGMMSTEDCTAIRQSFIGLGMPEWTYDTDEVVYDMVWAIARQYMYLSDTETSAREAFLRIVDENGVSVLGDIEKFVSLFHQYAPYSNYEEDFFKAAIEINAIDILLNCDGATDTEKRDAIQQIRDRLKEKGVMSRYHRDFVMKCFVKLLEWEWSLAGGWETQFDS